MNTRFWMVLGSGEPRYRHSSMASASREAERLAVANPGISFFVLEAIAVVVKGEINWSKLEPANPEEDVPF